MSQLKGQLIQEMEERIKKLALVRFQENQLTQTNLDKLAEWSLTLDEFHPIRLNYDQTAKEIAITYASNLKFSKTLIKNFQLLQSTRGYQKVLFRAWEQREGGILVKNIHLKEELKNANER